MSITSIKERIAQLKNSAQQTEVYSRIVGYYRNVKNWNTGKKQEFKERKTYKEPDDARTD